jgi:hypothetical protein
MVLQTQFNDLNAAYEGSGIYDLRFENGGIKWEEGFFTPICASLLTDSLDDDAAFMKKRGCFGNEYGNNVYKIINSGALTYDTVNTINSIFKEVLQNNFIRTGVWKDFDISFQFSSVGLIFNITVQIPTEITQYSFELDNTYQIN